VALCELSSFVIASDRKGARQSSLLQRFWIASSGFALLAMTMVKTTAVLS
jgi:hypothetical protein